MNQYRKYVFERAHKHGKLLKKAGLTISMSILLRNSWARVKICLRHGINPITDKKL